MADPEETPSEPTSTFWARMKIIMGLAPAIVALGTAITAIVKVYDQSNQKAVYETLGKKVEENAAALQDTHSDVKAVWAYLNGMAAGKAEVSEVVDQSSNPPPPKVTNQPRPKNNLPNKFSTAPETKIGPDDVAEVAVPQPKVNLNVAQESNPRKALPDISAPPKVERLPSFEDLIERPKSKAH